MADWTVTSTEPDTPKANQWQVVSHEPEGVQGVGDAVKGALQLVGSSVLNIPHAAVAAGQDIYHRLTGNAEAPTTHWGEFPIEPGTPGARVQAALSAPGPISPIDQMRNERRAELQRSIQGTVAGDIAQGVGQVGEDISNIAPAVGTLNLGRKLITSGVRTGLEASGAGTDWKAAGFRNGGAHPIARNIADQSGQEALTLHNQDVGNTITNAEAGVPHGTQLGYDTLADARAEPNAVWNRTANALPTQELPEETVNAVNNAARLDNVSTMTDADRARIQAMAQRATSGARSGQQVIEDMRTLRQEGFKRMAAEDVDQQNIGKAQIGMARALEDYAGKALPENADVSLDQFQAARKALAKNWTVQEALRGSDVDMQALARIQRADPELLDGGLKTIADFANGPGREVTNLANRYNPPGPIRDLAGVVNIHRPVQSTIQGIPGVGSTARRFLTGDTAQAIQRAQEMFPGRAPDAFAPLNSAQLPGGRLVRPGETGGVGAEGTGIGVNPNPSPAAPMGDYARVMSEGVPPTPPQGLSLGPMGAPQGEGLPFHGSPEVFGAQPVHGGAPSLSPRFVDDYGNEVNPNEEPRSPIELGDRFARGAQLEDRPASVIAGRPTVPNPNAEPSLGDLVAELNDYAKVKSQGVPEGTTMRTGPRTGPSKPWLMDENRANPRKNDISALLEDIFGPEQKFSNNASGQTDVSQEFANWQAERQAAGVTRHRYDPGTDEMVPMHSTSSRDPTSVKGRPVFDRDAHGNYTVVDRGGLSPNALNGIINRITQLGDNF